MEPRIAISQAFEETGSLKRERRASFSAVRALRSLSISSQISSSSEPDSPPAQRRRALLRKNRVPSLTPDLARNLSKSSTEDNRTSTSTRPTSPSGTCSQGTSVSGDHVSVVKFGALHAESSLLKTKKEHYLVLTPSALFKFKSRAAALEQFPQASASANVTETFSSAPSLLSSKGSLGSSKDFKHLKAGAEVHIPLERIVSVFKDEGTRPCFGIEMWWRDPNETTIFSRLELDFGLPEDRDDWLKQIRHATRLRCKSMPDERAPPDIESIFKQIVEAKPRQRNHSQLDIFPVIPRRAYARPRANSGEVKKHWRDGSSFYLALSKNSCLLAQFMRSGGQTIHKHLVQFGLASLSRANASLNDERFDLVFRLPMDRPERLDLSSRHHRTILSKLFKADTYLKPAWPLWTRREVFVIDGESQPIHLPEGEDYGGFKRTLEAFLEAYHCADVNWTVQWKDARYQPEFRLLPPTRQPQYSAYQLLAVFRALRYNDFFKSLSFRDIDFSSLSWLSDNNKRLESTMNFDTLAAVLRYLELGESQCLRRLVLNNCGLTGDMATALLCRLGKGRDVDLSLNENPLETGSIDWIHLIEGNETPRMLHLDMIEFLHQSNFHRLLTALTRNKTIEFLSMVGTGPPAGANSEMSEALFKFFKENDTLRFLDLSGYSGKLEDSQMGWGLSGALSGLMQNASLRQLRIRNHDLGAAEDVTELCRVLATNEGLAMLDCQNNNFNHHQFGKLVHALKHNHRLISFPWSKADLDCALQQEKRIFMKSLSQPGKPPPSTLSKSAESRLAGLLKWLKEYWESEAKKAEDIIQRNRDDLANGLLEFDSEYLEAWEDRNLPSWFTLRSRAPVRAEELNRLSVISLDMPSSTSASSPGLPGLPALPAIDVSETASESFLGTYTIEEESPAPNRTSPLKSNTPYCAPPLQGGGSATSLVYATPLQGGGSTTSLASSIASPPEIHHQRVVEDLTLDTW
ncbi:hypothetical protein DL764_001224 [Monosporascus ibericus]|uniref:PH domain-containing protein n=1 Tax=Monosporascus ibericus TaxID=155417 RepID=A0A4V1XCF2_9PEZI|nr:hypothetical protein DL764_001224 [Monosporascus ibericus]